ncbi:vacuolar protein sorting-associated protein 26C isoform X4 [Pelodiscus sinensis]
MEGSVNLQLSAKSVGVFEAFYNSVKPIQVINSTIEMVKPGKLPSGKTEIPFEFPLHMKGNKVLYETYHGVFVNIQYTLRCDMRRSLLAKDLTKTCEFIVHSAPQKGKLMPSPVDFTITPETLQNVKERASLPKFLIKGHLNSTNCIITQPLTGELVVENAEAAVKSIELQLVRVETCGCAEGYARDATEIQNIQIADGDVCRNLPIPIYMVFPRLFTCPTLETTNFKVGNPERCSQETLCMTTYSTSNLEAVSATSSEACSAVFAMRISSSKLDLNEVLYSSSRCSIKVFIFLKW